MAVTRLKRKDQKNKTRATNKQIGIKILSSMPVIKKVDVDKIKEEFAKSAKKPAPKAEKPVAEEKPAPAKAEAKAVKEAPKEATAKPKATSKPAAKAKEEAPKAAAKKAPAKKKPAAKTADKSEKK